MRLGHANTNTRRMAFSFTLDTRCKDTLASTATKRVSPSTLRRNAKRREEFLKKKLKPTTEQEKIVTEGGVAATKAVKILALPRLA